LNEKLGKLHPGDTEDTEDRSFKQEVTQETEIFPDSGFATSSDHFRYLLCSLRFLLLKKSVLCVSVVKFCIYLPD
jgi:hypothetical protein